MNLPIIWVHGDCLSPANPALKMYPDAPAIWVWDDALIDQWQLSLKRIKFIYECLLELPVVIRRGDVATEIVAFAQECDRHAVVTVTSPSPRFKDICQKIAPLPITVLPIEPFFAYEGYIDLKSFSRYWKVAQRYL